MFSYGGHAGDKTQTMLNIVWVLIGSLLYYNS